MGLKNGGNSEFTGARKELIDFCLNDERSIYDVRKKLNVSPRRIDQIISELNDAGLIYFHDVNGVKTIAMKKNKIKIEYETHQFFPYLYVMLVGTVLSILSSVFIIYSYKFLVGATFMTGVMLVFFIFKILNAPDIRHYFLKNQHKRVKQRNGFLKV